MACSRSRLAHALNKRSHRNEPSASLSHSDTVLRNTPGSIWRDCDKLLNCTLIKPTVLKVCRVSMCCVSHLMSGVPWQDYYHILRARTAYVVIMFYIP